MHVFEAQFGSISNLQSMANLHPMKTSTQNIFWIDDIIMSSRDLLCIFEYLNFPMDFIHRFQGAIFFGQQTAICLKVIPSTDGQAKVQQKKMKSWWWHVTLRGHISKHYIVSMTQPNGLKLCMYFQREVFYTKTDMAKWHDVLMMLSHDKLCDN